MTGKPPTKLENILHAAGYDGFRPGQQKVVENLLMGNDCAVFWATGQGKSLCYQLPSMFTNRPSVIVSPLISLMEDQCAKLNSTVLAANGPIATFLGSGQRDPTEEGAALNGERLFIYVTPERMCRSDFLESLARLHSRKPLALIAIDEAHCVSSWGHDFRPEFRQLHCIREHHAFQSVPLIALTATAVPEVQEDIVKQLGLRSPYTSLKSFDRDNLKLIVKPKRSGGPDANLDFLVNDLKKRPRGEATIVYCVTRKDVEKVTEYLQERFVSSEDQVQIRGYHAGMSLSSREEAHYGFLSGEVACIVATTAFGMGIDKTDTRRVVHYGPPKTIEEYYQQIGRAGRDGLPAKCVMICNDMEFARYYDDFYLGNLHGGARKHMEASIDALRKYAADTVNCRRKMIMNYFHEKTDYTRCGTCDCCINAERFKGDQERDMYPMASLIIMIVRAVKGCPMSQLLPKVKGGNSKESYLSPLLVQRVQEARNTLPNSLFTDASLKEIVAQLVRLGYLKAETKSTAYRKYLSYNITKKGSHAIEMQSPIMMPVLAVVRENEQVKEEQKIQRVKLLEDAGIDTNLIPPTELQVGAGPSVTAHLQWLKYLKKFRDKGDTDHVDALLDLKYIIMKWRLECARQQRVDPTTVMAEATVVKVAYAAATSPLSAEGLRGIGLRNTNVDQLAAELKLWGDKHRPATAESNGTSRTIALPEGVTRAPKWMFAVEPKTGKVPTWNESYVRFSKGHHPDSIAVDRENGRAIQSATVVGHLLESLIQGRPLDLQRLVREAQASMPLPSVDEWKQLVVAEHASGIDLKTTPKYNKKELICHLERCAQLADIPAPERSEEEQAILKRWYGCINWYEALTRAGIKPTNLTAGLSQNKQHMYRQSQSHSQHQQATQLQAHSNVLNDINNLSNDDYAALLYQGSQKRASPGESDKGGPSANKRSRTLPF